QHSTCAKQQMVLIMGEGADAAASDECVRLQYSSAPEIARFHPCPQARKRSPEIEPAAKLQCHIVSCGLPQFEVTQSPSERGPGRNGGRREDFQFGRRRQKEQV